MSSTGRQRGPGYAQRRAIRTENFAVQTENFTITGSVALNDSGVGLVVGEPQFHSTRLQSESDQSETLESESEYYQSDDSDDSDFTA